MPRENNMVECPKCHRQILDNGGPFLICRFCGYKVTRAELDKQSEEETSQILLVNLQHDVNKLKFFKNIAIIVGSLCLLAPILLLALVTIKNIFLLSITFIIALGWLIAAGVLIKKLDVKKSKLFDMVGQRDF